MDKYNYDTFFSVEKDEKGNVQMINANVLKINDSTASLKIQGSQVSWSAQATMAKYQSLGSLNNRNVLPLATKSLRSLCQPG